MPLIIVTGLPCSGKTHRAQQIAASLTEFISSSTDPTISRRTVQLIPSQHARADRGSHGVGSETTQDAASSLRDQIYTSAAEEKTARAAEFSAVKRALGRDNVIVADALNYIKGYRYQLWCEAKAAGTRCCVVHVAAREDECAAWNAERARARGSGRRAGEDGEHEHGTHEQGLKKHDGENVLGELIPESHTAIYGDRGVRETETSRSRSSSLDDMEGVTARAGQPHEDETMTLKSLYIRDRADTGSATATCQPQASTSSPAFAPSPSPAPGVSNTMPPPPSTASAPYSPSTLSSLCMRYEPPSPFSRWDTPLFVVPSTDVAPPMADIWTAIYPTPTRPTSKKALSQLGPRPQSHLKASTPEVEDTGRENAGANSNATKPEDPTNGGSVVKPHAATVLPRATGADALQTLESATMEVVKQLLAQARAHTPAILQGEGGEVDLRVPVGREQRAINSAAAADAEEEEEEEGEEVREEDAEAVHVTLRIPPGVNLNQPLLQRLRRKYTQIQRGGIAHGQGYIVGRRAVVESFVGFLADEWDEDEPVVGLG
ncbi:hypothetical protein A1O7_09517 [Cladophialophora yegresii CBS 114405]|uniref:Protein KTI12 n=1 Tax=Cladophialophora yegresii CBS 114405 TaxID=1182544 RepID=W9VME1_9EURO|nr:uncharacterized protein A1O7_09517 [Cladophialophora yegresii CBS 114405]EXJ54180.1 hypothetical protein A1O7_09517 [Cladophialophora yegresii CBS 114405]